MPDQGPFHLRHFSLLHHHSTMKVGTDAILLGAWVNPNNANTILDIGCGSGILALMMAQRNANALITAVDLDDASVLEAQLNFETSQWRDRLNAIQIDIRFFAENTQQKFELIVSNPPFFIDSFKPTTIKRKLARHTDNLNFHELIQIAIQLLSPEGIFALVLPIQEATIFKNMAFEKGLFLKRQLSIIPIEGRAPNRLNMEFCKMALTDTITENFVIRQADGKHSPQYNAMLHDFYLGLNF